jgi:thiol-disulfide isomerase/thioredoxin
MRRAVKALIPAMTPGLAVLVGAVLIAVVGGTVWRQANGRMRSPRARTGAGASVPLRPQLLQGAGIQGAGVEADLDGFSSSGTRGSAVPGSSATALDEGIAPDQGITLTGEELGRALGTRATLLQFSSAFCAPCRATRRILADVAGMTDGVAHIEIDAESRLDLVRQLRVLRTPTVLVLAGDGRIVRRASGQPRKPDVIAAIGAAVDG